jgi:signal transduction histidine kinase
MAERAAAMRRTRHTLRARLAYWMVLSTACTLVIFACVVYALVRAEANESMTSRDEAGEEAGGGAQDAREQVLFAMLIAAPLCLALSAAGAYVLSRRSLAPLDAVIRKASDTTASTLQRRLDVPARNDELLDLVLALNALFDRLNDGFDALGSYAASASHELRTPLAVVSNQLEVALRHPRKVEEWESIARTSLDEMSRLSVLVEALLELARAGSTTTSRRFELRDELDQTCSSLEAHVRAGGAQLLLPHDGEDIWVEGDSGLLMNAVRELVRNAARYSPKGSTVRVRVELRRDELVAIVVEDDGPGVATAERSVIFAPFTRGRASSEAGSDARRGLGLGLAIAKRSVEAWCGTLTVDDSPDGGARFTILVPTVRTSL